MYTNNQYPDANYTAGYAGYPATGYNYGYQDYGQTQYPAVTTTIQPGPPGEEYPQNNWAPARGYTNPPPALPSTTNNASVSVVEGKKEAVAQEIQHQKTQLIKQREEYVRKVTVLKRELDLLKNQKQDLLSQSSPVRDLDAIIRENEKLQDEIQSKIKAIHNVIEMLSSIIKDGKKIPDLEAQLSEDLSPCGTKSSKSLERDVAVGTEKCNYIHYDPELHWCRFCDKFPKTAKEFLQHLQTKKHQEKMQESDVGDNTPWHKLPAEPELPHYEGAPKKRIPIKGLQFFISSPSWYCKLCDTWIGDLHCASHHLKSQAHFQNYANFVEQNPHWEMEWLKDREKALSRADKNASSDSEDNPSKRKKHHDKRSSDKAKDKKKKKRSKKHKKHQSSDSSSSSSSSDSSTDDEADDRSRSIRVAMRNIKVQNIMNEDLSGKWEMLGRLVEEHKKKEEELKRKEEAQKPKPNEDHLISQWMTISEPQEKEKILFDNLKDRMKQKHEAERVKYAELEKKKRDKERLERELQEMKEREEKEMKEKEEKERKQCEEEQLRRIHDTNRDQVRFKASREKFRRQAFNVSSDEEDNARRSRSPAEKRYRRHSPERNDRYRRDDDRHREDDRKRDDRKRDDHRKDDHRFNSRSKDNRSHHRSHSKSKSRSPDRDQYKQEDDTKNGKVDAQKKKPPGPPSYKKLPFIGRMPLYKNKKPDDNKVERELKKEEYEVPRQTRFQPGTLARAFIPEPEVVCFPKLATIPPLMTPPPAPAVTILPPAAPKISEEKSLKAPPPPKIGQNEKPKEEKIEDKPLPAPPEPYEAFSQYYPPNPEFLMYPQPQLYDFPPQNEPEGQPPIDDVPLSHTMPLLPPPLPPTSDADDLALLGISADDMAAQSF